MAASLIAMSLTTPAFLTINTIIFSFGVLSTILLGDDNYKMSKINKKLAKVYVNNLVEIVGKASISGNVNENKQDFIKLCYQRFLEQKSFYIGFKNENEPTFQLQVCEDAWEKIITPTFLYQLRSMYNYIFNIKNNYNDTFSKEIFSSYNESLNNYPLEKYEPNLNIQLPFSKIDEKFFYSILVSIVLIILPFIIDQRINIYLWFKTQTSSFLEYFKNYSTFLGKSLKLKLKKTVEKTVEKELKQSKRKSRKIRSLLKKGGIRSLRK